MFTRTLAPSVAALALPLAHSATAAECPPEQIGIDVRALGPLETIGDETVALLGHVRIGQGIEDRVLRLRRITLAPGGQVGWHEHGDRSLLIFVESGVYTEFRSDCLVPIRHRAGDTIEETLGTKHWWRNEGAVPVVLMMSDISTPDAVDRLNLPPAPPEPARLNEGPSETPEEAQVRAEIMPLFTAMQAAANVHDAEAHLAPLVRGPDLTFVFNGRIIRGWDELLAQQRAWWPAGRIPLADEAHRPYPIVEGPDFHLLGPRHAMVTFVMNARRVYPDRVTRRPLAVSKLWEKRGDGWRIVHAHESVGPERPEP